MKEKFRYRIRKMGERFLLQKLLDEKVVQSAELNPHKLTYLFDVNKNVNKNVNNSQRKIKQDIPQRFAEHQLTVVSEKDKENINLNRRGP